MRCLAVECAEFNHPPFTHDVTIKNGIDVSYSARIEAVNIDGPDLLGFGRAL